MMEPLETREPRTIPFGESRLHVGTDCSCHSCDAPMSILADEEQIDRPEEPVLLKCWRCDAINEVWFEWVRNWTVANAVGGGSDE